MEFLLHLLLTGVSIGSSYALGGLGFVLIYKATRVFNFAHGQLIMAGAYLFYALRVQLGLPALPAGLLAITGGMLIGLAIERLFLRRMVGRSHISIIMLTVGLAAVIENMVGMIWGTQPKPPPPLLPTNSVQIFGVAVSQLYVWNLAVAATLICGFVAFFQHTRYGVAMRAVAFNQDFSALSGISVPTVFGLSWGFAAAMAAVSGIFMVQLVGLDLSLADRGLAAFPAAVLGGLDSIAGVILGGLIIGIVESLAGGYIDPLLGGGAKEVIGFVVLVAILMIRPYGLFGTPEIKKV